MSVGGSPFRPLRSTTYFRDAMWGSIIVLIAVGVATAERGWKEGYEYNYTLNITKNVVRHQPNPSFHSVANIRLNMTADVRIQLRDSNTLNLQLSNLDITNNTLIRSPGVEQHWTSKKVAQKLLNLAEPFELRLDNGLVKEIHVDKCLSGTEVSIIQLVASLIQVDTREPGTIASTEKNITKRIFYLNEVSTMGKCKTLYTITPLSHNLAKINPSLVPMPQLHPENYYDIKKTKSFPDCMQNQLDMISSAGSIQPMFSMGRLVISGDLESYTIQSSHLKETVIKDSIGSRQEIRSTRLHLALQSVQETAVTPHPLRRVDVIKTFSSEEQRSKNTECHHVAQSSTEAKSRTRRAVLHMKSPIAKGRTVKEPASSLSNEDFYLQPTPKMDEAPNAPLLPFFIGLSGNQIQKGLRSSPVDAAALLSVEIGSDFQTPNEISKKQTLAKLNILVRFLRTMTKEQLEKTEEKIDGVMKKTTNNKAMSIYRDAVAESGTGPALMFIKDKVISEKWNGEEAAEVIARIPDTIMYPTPEYVGTFYEIMTNEAVAKQEILNTTSIFTFSRLLRRALSRSSSRFPTLSFGKLSKQLKHDMKTIYIPTLAQWLQDALQKQDRANIQTYSRALGNIGHPDVLGVFEPYIEGKEGNMTTFQRLSIIMALDELAEVHPKLMQAVFLRIYQNSLQESEVRIGAVILLMKTNPPASILQMMAQNTNIDPCKQVNSAVKSAIQSAAKLSAPQYRELAKNAMSALEFLNGDELGYEYSKTYLTSKFMEALQLTHNQEFSYIQKEEGSFPSSIFYSSSQELGGYHPSAFKFNLLSSNSEEVLDLFTKSFSVYVNKWNQKTNEYWNKKKDVNQWTWSAINETLKLRPIQRSPVEGSLLTDIMGSKRFIPFAERDIKSLVSTFKNFTEAAKVGVPFNYTKFYNGQSVTFAFPTATGLPFVYSLNVPTIHSISGNLKVNTKPDIFDNNSKSFRIPQSVLVSANIDIVYTSKIVGTMGFVMPHSHHMYMAGMDSNYFYRLPVNASVNLDTQHTQLEIMIRPHEDADAKLFELSSALYTTKHDLTDLDPAIFSSDTHQIMAERPSKMHTVVGLENTGWAFDVNVETPDSNSKWANVFDAVNNGDFLAVLVYGTEVNPVSYYNISVAYNHEMSTANQTNIVMTFDTAKPNGEKLNLNENKNKERNNKNQYQKQGGWAPDAKLVREIFMERVMSNMDRPTSWMMNVSIEHTGNTSATYMATAAHSTDISGEESRVSLFLKKFPAQPNKSNRPLRAALEVITNKPNNVFQNTDGGDIVKVSAKLDFGEKSLTESNVRIEMQLSQSQDWRNSYEYTSAKELCDEEIKEGLYTNSKCKQSNARAHFYDNYTAQMTYNNIPEYTKDQIIRLLWFSRYFAYTTTEDSGEDNPAGTDAVQVSILISSDLESVDLKVLTSDLTIKYNELPLPQWLIPFMSAESRHLGLKDPQNLIQSTYEGNCAVRGNYVETFDGLTYKLGQSDCWHVMTIFVPKSGTEQTSGRKSSQRLAVLTRTRDSGRKEIKIVGNDNILQVIPEPSGFQVIYRNQSQLIPIGHIHLTLPDEGIELQYEGDAVHLQLSSAYRGKVRGLCGTFKGTPEEDFTSPEGCIFINKEEFTSSYSLFDGKCSPLSSNSSSECYQKNVVLGDVITDAEAGRLIDISWKNNYLDGVQTGNQPSTQQGNQDWRYWKDKYAKKSQSEGYRRFDQLDNSGKGSDSNDLNNIQNRRSGEKNQRDKGNNPGRNGRQRNYGLKMVDGLNCTEQHVQVIKDIDRTCFSQTPLPTCQSPCIAMIKIEKTIDFDCIEDLDHKMAGKAAVTVAHDINQAQNQKKIVKTITVKVPAKCST